MNRTTALALAAAGLLLVSAWVVAGLLAGTTTPALGGPVVVSTLSPTTPSTPATTPGSGATRVTPAPQCPAGQTPEPDAEDPDDRCDD